VADAIHAEWSLRFRNELLRLRTVRVGGDALVLKWQRMMMRKIVLYGRKLVEKSMVDTSDAAQGHHGRGSQILKTDDRWMVRRVMTGCVADRLRLCLGGGDTRSCVVREGQVRYSTKLRVVCLHLCTRVFANGSLGLLCV